MTRVHASTHLFRRQICRPSRQGGAFLLVFALLLVIGVAWLGVRVLSTAGLPVTAAPAALVEARDALFGATSQTTGAAPVIAGVKSPGRMPAPDFLDPAGGPPNVYDGNTNLACARSTWVAGATLTTLGGPGGVATTLRCLGRLPWANLGLGSYAAVPANDPLGLIPWYAISANLADACVKALNPAILNTTYAAFATGACALVLPPSRPFPWLTVRDPKGNLVTDRAAVVLILPGPALAAQARPVAPMQGPAAYLDTVVVTAGCAQPCVPGTYDNARFNWPDNVGLSFIQCAPPGSVSTSDPSYGQPYNCNDRIVFITIDELMEIAERRVTQYLADELRGYFDANRFFPYAAPLSETTAALRGQCQNTVTSGLIPAKATTVAPANPSPCTHAEFSSRLQSWFNINLWGDYSYYAVAGDCTQPTPAAGPLANCGGGTGVRLAAGGTGNARALVIGAGAAIAAAPFAASKLAAQVRPSTAISDYLDSVENSNGNTVYDSPTSLTSSSYNDKVMVVAP